MLVVKRKKRWILGTILMSFLKSKVTTKCAVISSVLAIIVASCVLFKVYSNHAQGYKVNYSAVEVEKLEKMSELAVEKVIYNGITEVKNQKLIDAFSETGLMHYKADVTAAVDFSGIKPEIDDKNKTITVRLPSASIVEINIIKSSVEWNYVSPNKLDGKEFLQIGLKQAEEECRQKIDEMEIIDAANKRAVSIVENFFEGYEKRNKDRYEVKVIMDETDRVEENVNVTA